MHITFTAFVDSGINKMVPSTLKYMGVRGSKVLNNRILRSGESRGI